jgi:hypothetical protein
VTRELGRHGVACDFTVPERDGLKGWLGFVNQGTDTTHPASVSRPSQHPAHGAPHGAVAIFDAGRLTADVNGTTSIV